MIGRRHAKRFSTEGIMREVPARWGRVLAGMLAAAGLLPALSLAGALQDSARRPDSILLVVPEADTVTTPSAAYRLSASVAPGCQVFLNGMAVKVYPSGAFDGLLDLNVGENFFTISAYRTEGKIASKSFLIVRTKPLESTRSDTLAIEDALMEPASSMWLTEGDLLEVQCKGTPHCRGTFLDGRPMHELPASVRGLGGIYQGVYKLTAGDTMAARPVVFRLEDSAGNVVEKESPGRISFNPPGLPLVGVTRGDRPSLRYSLASDRLGGAIFSTVTTGVRLAITGKSGEFYRVELAAGQTAWIDAGSVELQPPGTHLPHATTGTWNVYGDEKYDYVTIHVGDRLPYASTQEMDPTRLQIDLFGATANSNWIIQKPTTKEIKSVDYRQTGAGVVRITIALNHRQVWGYSISYSGALLVIRIRRQPEVLKLKSLTFAIDAGHGGSNDGALGCTGAKEKDVTLAVARHLKEQLEDRGAKVVMIRDKDTTIATSDRLKKVLGMDAAMLISVHVNSIGLTSNPEDTKGVGLYYKYPCYRPLSDFLLRDLEKTGLTPFGTVGSFNFALNAPTELPNALVELGYISNPEDEMKLIDDDFRADAAKRIVEGIKDFLDSCANGE